MVLHGASRAVPVVVVPPGSFLVTNGDIGVDSISQWLLRNVRSTDMPPLIDRLMFTVYIGKSFPAPFLSTHSPVVSLNMMSWRSLEMVPSLSHVFLPLKLVFRIST